MADEPDLEPTFDDDGDPFDPQDRTKLAKDRTEQQARKDDEATAFLRDRRDAYIRAFGEKLVLEDLREFSRVDQTPWDADPRIHALLTGRYEVGRRILDHIDLTFEQLVEKYTRKPE